MDQKDVQIKNLNSLLAEATADSELNKLVEEAENTESVKDSGKEVVPEVSKEDVLGDEQTGADVKVQNDDGAGKFEGEKDEEVKDLKEDLEDDFGIPDGNIESADLKLPEGTLYRKNDEDTNLGIEKNDVLDTVKDSTDLELPEGVLTGKKDVDFATSEDDILGQTDSDKDIASNKDFLTEATEEDNEKEAFKSKTMTVKRPDQHNRNGKENPFEEVRPGMFGDKPEYTYDPHKFEDGLYNKRNKKSDAVSSSSELRDKQEFEKEYRDDPKSDLDKPVENDNADKVSAKSDKTIKDNAKPLEEGLKLPEGVITYKDSDEAAPSVDEEDVLDTLKDGADLELPEGVLTGKKDVEVGKSNEDILGTTDSAADIDDKKLNEAIDRLNLAFESLHEEEQPKVAVEDEKHENTIVPDVDTNDVLKTVAVAADLSDCNKAINDKDCDCKSVPAAKTYETPKISDMVKVKGLDYKTLKEAVELGKDWFDSDDKVVALKEQVAVLLAKENDDLLYEELSRLESQANAVREKIEKKYSIISNNRVDSLLESMDAVEQRIAANKDNMFKKLVEQQELNSTVANADTLSADEIAFGK